MRNIIFIITYQVPHVPHIRVRLEKEAQGYNFKDHFHCENDLKNHVRVLLILQWRHIRVVKSQKHTVCQNCKKDKSVEPPITIN